MFRSLFLAGTIAGAVAQPAFNSSIVSPVRVIFDPRILSPTGTSADLCDAITKVFDSGATEIVIDAVENGVVTPNSLLDVWVNQMTNPTGRECLDRNAAKGSLGVLTLPTSSSSTAAFLSAAAKIAKDNGFSFVYWPSARLDCTQDNADYLGQMIAGAVKTDAGVDFSAGFSTAYLSECPIVLTALDNAVAADKTHLKSIQVSYFDQGTPFTTYESVFVQSPSAISKVSISELNSAVTNLKGYFGVMKPLNTDVVQDKSDLIPIATLKQWTCQAQRNATIGYNKGLDLVTYGLASNADDMINGGLRSDCDGGALPGPPPSGSGTTFAISAIAVIVTVVSLLS